MENKKLILFLVLLLGFVHSADPKIDIKYPLDPRCDQSIPKGLLDEVSNIGYCTGYDFLQTVINGLVSTITELYKILINLMAASPDPKWFCNQYIVVMELVYSFMGLSIAILSAYMVLYSPNPASREKASHWLENILYMAIYLAGSFIIFSWLVDINSAITTQFLSSANQSFDISISISNIIFAFILCVFFSGAVILTFLTLLLRYLLIPILLMFFPIGIFLFHTPPLKNWGALIIRASGIILFMTSIDSLIIYITSTVVSNGQDPILAEPLLKGLGFALGIGVIGYVNMFLYKTILLSVGLGGIEDRFKSINLGGLYNVL